MTTMRIGLLFGGRSGEHEVSISSALAIARALAAEENASKYEVLPFYIQKNGRWLSGTLPQQVLASGKPLEIEEQTGQDDSPAGQFPNFNAVDVWFPVLHGPNGEDGTVQGLLKLMQVPFVGSGVLGSALGMDKIAMKMAFAQAGLPQVKYIAVNRSEIWSNPCVFPKLCDKIEASFGLSLLCQTGKFGIVCGNF